ncbi:MAG TPA: hypoxanthine phosphoribosyltransferase [Polyangiaceae bacterium]|nr:hypoxanthine phosphoribosyltransferase [Polyangiaceae bacterium]
MAEPSLKVLFSAQQIQTRVSELGRAIKRDYGEGPLMLLCVLKGSFMFAADLARAIDSEVHIEFLGVRSYGDSTRSSGAVEITQDLSAPIVGRDVVIVEDIVDTGLTADYLLRQVQSRGPRSVRLCALLDKPSRRKCSVRVDYAGFEIDEGFVVGYGLDLAQRYRNLPDVCLLDLNEPGHS